MCRVWEVKVRVRMCGIANCPGKSGQKKGEAGNQVCCDLHFMLVGEGREHLEIGTMNVINMVFMAVRLETC